jgi:hypothetical protein
MKYLKYQTGRSLIFSKKDDIDPNLKKIKNDAVLLEFYKHQFMGPVNHRVIWCQWMVKVMTLVVQCRMGRTQEGSPFKWCLEEIFLETAGNAEMNGFIFGEIDGPLFHVYDNGYW